MFSRILLQFPSFLPSTSSLRSKTIFALSSGSLPSAVAIIRITGDKSEEALKFLTRKKDFKPREMFYAKIYDENENLLDRAMAVMLHGRSRNFRRVF